MNKFQKYVQQLTFLSSRQAQVNDAAVRAALDGQVSAKFRAMVPIAERKRNGTFFTPAPMAKALAQAIRPTLTPESIVADPACGAGDLLLAVLPDILSIIPYGDVTWAKRLIAIDRDSVLVEAARARVTLAARFAGIDKIRRADLIHFRVRDFLVDPTVIRNATHILLNPPYFSMRLYQPLKWAEGSVSAAAVFVQKCLAECKRGTVVAAILPDVLRSGPRYKSWRRLVTNAAEVQTIQVLGQFDAWTDVDVFLLVLRVGHTQSNTKPSLWSQQPRSKRRRLSSLFSLRVGDVVNNRDPHKGPWVRYLTAKDANPWAVIREVKRHRRFLGRTYLPPFIVIRRTSSPSDRKRPVASLVTGRERVAIDNHLVVVQPIRRSRQLCNELLEQLRLPSTTKWLNKRIRCRHLTIDAISDLGFKPPR